MKAVSASETWTAPTEKTRLLEPQRLPGLGWAQGHGMSMDFLLGDRAKSEDRLGEP